MIRNDKNSGELTKLVLIGGEIREILSNSVMRVGSDTFGDPIFQKGLQN